MENKIPKKAFKAIYKMYSCPQCNSQLKNFTRKNYPFGRKSKARITKGEKCINCDYENVS